VIASIRGRLEATGADWAIVDVNGVGFQVFAPTSTLASVGKLGGQVRFFTHLHVREDVLALYGFATYEELSLFQTVTGVSGIGPKLALSMLSSFKVELLTAAIGSGDVDLLMTVPGIGKKIAGRLVLELKDKIGSGAAIVPLQVSQANADVVAALTTLGYSVAEATRAVAAVADDSLSLEEKVRQALGYFAER
jgi:holliday junction DNA helicase RuvA